MNYFNINKQKPLLILISMFVHISICYPVNSDFMEKFWI